MPDNYEAWREALIAFLEAEGQYMPTTLANLRRGAPLTEDNKRIIRGLMAASHKVAA